MAQQKRWTHRPEGSNWGDFGADDQLGRMNLITPERRCGGIAEAREGVCFSLSLPLDLPGGNELTEGLRGPPRLFASKMGGSEAYNIQFGSESGCCDITSDDGVLIYSQYSTQWDSFAHWGQVFDADGDGVAEKVYYNGYRAGKHLITTSEGGPYAHALGIENMAATGAQGRGVLVDLVDAGHVIDYDVLMRLIEAQRVDVRTGDFLCLHTGADDHILEMRGAPDRQTLLQVPALDGRDTRLLRWIDESGVAALCSDNMAIEITDMALSGETHDGTVMPIHTLCLFKLGIHLGELWRLTELKAWLKAHDRSAFLLTAPPWRLPGSVGSPVNPVATV